MATHKSWEYLTTRLQQIDDERKHNNQIYRNVAWQYLDEFWDELWAYVDDLRHVKGKVSTTWDEVETTPPQAKVAFKSQPMIKKARKRV